MIHDLPLPFQTWLRTCASSPLNHHLGAVCFTCSSHCEQINIGFPACLKMIFRYFDHWFFEMQPSTGSPQLLPWPRARDLQLSICMGWGTWETNMKFKMDTRNQKLELYKLHTIPFPKHLFPYYVGYLYNSIFTSEDAFTLQKLELNFHSFSKISCSVSWISMLFALVATCVTFKLTDSSKFCWLTAKTQIHRGPGFYIFMAVSCGFNQVLVETYYISN